VIDFPIPPELHLELTELVGALDAAASGRSWWQEARPACLDLLADLAAHLDAPPPVVEPPPPAEHSQPVEDDDWEAECAAALLEVPGLKQLQNDCGRLVSITVRGGVAGPVYRAWITVGRQAVEGEDRPSEASAVDALRLELAERGMLRGAS
jgi:hypothetical protein